MSSIYYYYLLLIKKLLINMTPQGDIIRYAAESLGSVREHPRSEITLHTGSLGASSSQAFAVRV